MESANGLLEDPDYTTGAAHDEDDFHRMDRMTALQTTGPSCLAGPPIRQDTGGIKVLQLVRRSASSGLEQFRDAWLSPAAGETERLEALRCLRWRRSAPGDGSRRGRAAAFRRSPRDVVADQWSFDIAREREAAAWCTVTQGPGIDGAASGFLATVENRVVWPENSTGQGGIQWLRRGNQEAPSGAGGPRGHSGRDLALLVPARPATGTGSRARCRRGRRRRACRADGPAFVSKEHTELKAFFGITWRTSTAPSTSSVRLSSSSMAIEPPPGAMLCSHWLARGEGSGNNRPADCIMAICSTTSWRGPTRGGGSAFGGCVRSAPGAAWRWATCRSSACRG